MSKGWCVAAVCVAVLPVLPAQADGGARPPLLDVGSNGVKLTVGAATPNGTQPKNSIGETASLSVALPNGQAKVEGGFSTGAPGGDDMPSATNWNGGHIGLHTSLEGPAHSSVEIGAQSQFRNTVQEGQAVLATGAARADILEQSRQASLTGSIAPTSIVKLQFGTTLNQATQTDARLDLNGELSRSQLSTNTQNSSAEATVTPVRGLTLGGGADFETVSAQWEGGGAPGDAGTYSYVEPKVHAGLTPIDGVKLRTSFGEVVKPLNTANFVALAANPGRNSELTVAPEQQWQSQTSLDLKLAQDVAFTAEFTRAQIENVTELVPLEGGGQVPASVASGTRSEFRVNLNSSLAALGLPHTRIVTSGAWRSSRIEDPLTAETRRLSGEIPQQAQIKLVRDFPARDLKLGLTGAIASKQTLYQAAQVTQIDNSGTLGAFVEYSPGPFALQLNMDGLAGGQRSQRDIFYAGSRGTGAITDNIVTTTSGRKVSLSLQRTF
jgi:hypothetical protein